jgi:hypothetical protein
MKMTLTSKDLTRRGKSKDIDELTPSDFNIGISSFHQASQISYADAGFMRIMKDRYNGPSNAVKTT